MVSAFHTSAGLQNLLNDHIGEDLLAVICADKFKIWLFDRLKATTGQN
jgi:hypothetical protein